MIRLRILDFGIRILQEKWKEREGNRLKSAIRNPKSAITIIFAGFFLWTLTFLH